MISDMAPPMFGGIENYVLNLSKELIKQGNEVHWLTSKIANTKSEETYHGIKMHRVNIPFNNPILGRQLFPVASLKKGIDLAKKMDIIHVNTFSSGVLGWAIAKASGKPSVLFCHEFYGDLWNKVGHNLIEKKLYPMIENTIAKSPYNWFMCPSNYSKKTMMRYGIPGSRITVIKHGIDHKLFSIGNLKKNYRKIYNITGPTFGYLGRLGTKGTGQAKNVTGLLEASKYVFQEMPDAKLILGGKGFSDLKNHIKKLGIENNVINIEKIPIGDTSNFLKACDVIICPALSDGFCFLLAEASASGVPVIATKLGSHPERVNQNKNGILVNSHPKNISDSIIMILKNKKLASKLGKNGHKITDDLSWEKSAKEHIKIYEKLLHK